MALTDKKVLHSRPYNTRRILAGRAPRSIPQLEAAAVEGAADPRRLRRLVTMSVAAPPSAPIRASGRCPTESAEIQAAMAENAVLMT